MKLNLADSQKYDKNLNWKREYNLVQKRQVVPRNKSKSSLQKKKKKKNEGVEFGRLPNAYGR